MTAPPCESCGRSAPPSTVATVRHLIRVAIDEPYITQTELARRIDRSQKHVSQMLNGKSGLSMDEADRIMAALGWRLAVGMVRA